MNFNVLREALRQARHQAAVVRNDVQRVGMTLKEAAAVTGLNMSTIHSIENVKREPRLEPAFDTVERLVHAYGLTLSSFFARIEGLPIEQEAAQDQPPPLPSPSDETVPALTAEELHTIRALTKVIRESADREYEEAQGQPGAHRRHVADAHHPQAPPSLQTRSDRSRNAGRRRLKKKAKRPRT